MAYEMSELKKIGLGLIGFGIFFTFLGALLFFDRGLLALGNIFWLSGVAILLGWQSTWKIFTNRANYKGSVCFLLGLFFSYLFGGQLLELSLKYMVALLYLVAFGLLSRCSSIRFLFLDG
ncbi:GOT1/SFT2-LIKE VESCICLE TRANSPORT PROTEIN FAMILY [Salix purpurea]|uniref:GOT1/SFT2-LIKE VESCICLE TRANSPORT PROTEIN FAMILY n=1 Tax=Salix purpurea TaxID=77065 RepID=A0A9Q0P2K6_SALPP|nr:GOT1/SFT2-LIKE VESCICLE TRANSPORT PROTEIN FAMILY [Salix purpurea]